jgi:hypothetical protein
MKRIRGPCALQPAPSPWPAQHWWQMIFRTHHFAGQPRVLTLPVGDVKHPGRSNAIQQALRVSHEASRLTGDEPWV